MNSYTSLRNLHKDVNMLDVQDVVEIRDVAFSDPATEALERGIRPQLTR